MEVVTYNVESNIAIISLNRPEHINAFNVQMRDDLYEYLRLFQDDQEAKIAVIRGNGVRGFCAGADLSEFGTAPSQTIARHVRWARDLWGLFMSIDKPIIASLHGFVIGSGIEIASLCDVRIAANDARFRMPEVALGMIPAAGGTQTLPRLIGVDKTMDLILTNKEIDADEARLIGLVDMVVEPKDIYNETVSVAQNILSNGEKLNSAIKSVVRLGFEMDINSAALFESRRAGTFLG